MKRLIKAEEKLTVKKVKEIAKKNYNNGGDTIIECWDNKNIQDFIDGTGEYNKPATIKDLMNLFELYDDVSNDIKNS